MFAVFYSQSVSSRFSIQSLSLPPMWRSFVPLYSTKFNERWIWKELHSYAWIPFRRRRFCYGSLTSKMKRNDLWYLSFSLIHLGFTSFPSVPPPPYRLHFPYSSSIHYRFTLIFTFDCVQTLCFWLRLNRAMCLIMPTMPFQYLDISCMRNGLISRVMLQQWIWGGEMVFE